MTDAKTAWQQREMKEQEQEQAAVMLLKKHVAAAREDKLNGEVVLRLRYRDGGIQSKRVEVGIDVK